MIASDFCMLASKKYDSFEAEDLIYESTLPINTDDPVDSVVNYLQYLSYACDEYLTGDLKPDTLRSFFKNHISYWIPLFCDLLYRSANLSFYKEVAVGLRETLLFYDSEF